MFVFFSSSFFPLFLLGLQSLREAHCSGYYSYGCFHCVCLFFSYVINTLKTTFTRKKIADLEENFKVRILISFYSFRCSNSCDMSR